MAAWRRAGGRTGARPVERCGASGGAGGEERGRSSDAGRRAAWVDRSALARA